MRIATFKINKTGAEVFLGPKLGDITLKWSRYQKRMLYFFVPLEDGPDKALANVLATTLGNGKSTKDAAIETINHAVINLTTEDKEAV